jgi:hypothetical protein
LLAEQGFKHQYEKIIGRVVAYYVEATMVIKDVSTGMDTSQGMTIIADCMVRAVHCGFKKLQAKCMSRT